MEAGNDNVGVAENTVPSSPLDKPDTPNPLAVFVSGMEQFVRDERFTKKVRAELTLDERNKTWYLVVDELPTALRGQEKEARFCYPKYLSIDTKQEFPLSLIHSGPEMYRGNDSPSPVLNSVGNTGKSKSRKTAIDWRNARVSASGSLLSTQLSCTAHRPFRTIQQSIPAATRAGSGPKSSRTRNARTCKCDSSRTVSRMPLVPTSSTGSATSRV